LPEGGYGESNFITDFDLRLEVFLERSLVGLGLSGLVQVYLVDCHVISIDLPSIFRYIWFEGLNEKLT
jgi:hypothetical protein